KADSCTLAFAAMCSHKPPAVMIAINSTAKRKTLKSILERKEFVLGFPTAEQVAETDFIGIASGYDVDKIEKVGFTTTKAKEVNAPIINEMKVSIECKVMNIAEVGSHTQITGEIVNIQADEDVIGEKGKVDLKLLNPIVYDDVVDDYFEVGVIIAVAFYVGVKFRK
ncbi:MAG: flavin reductase family protein, partial [Methanobrevibacter sp.]|nr:flavin reductase family protein [Methanobrevibacter sp.]